jgi:macrolide-specific efflux system membrane fusion protein
VNAVVGALRSRRARNFALWALAAGALAAAILALNPEWVREQNPKAADGVRTVKATRGGLEVTVAAIGTFQPLEYVDVGAQISGQLKEVTVKLGDVVRRGQLIAAIDDTTARARLAQTDASLAGVRAQIAAKEAQIVLARAQRARNTRLVEHGFLSIATLDAAEATVASLEAEADSLRAQARSLGAVIEQAKTELRFAEVRAPMEGVVVALVARTGQALNAAQQAPVILRIANLQSLALIAQVSEADVVHVRPGMEVRFNLLGLADRNYAGRVRQILPGPNVVNSVVFYDVLIELPRVEELFRVGMTAQIYFMLARHPCMLKIPRVALPADLKPPRRVRLATLGADRKPRPLEVEITAANDTEGGLPCEVAERAGLAEGVEIAMPAAAAKKDKKR